MTWTLSCGNETQVSLVKGEWCHHCANIPMEKYPLFSRTLPFPPKRECGYTNATFFSQKYCTLVVGSNSWPVNHESCHLAVHCPRGNILPWLRPWHCTKNKRASSAFWTELSYPLLLSRTWPGSWSCEPIKWSCLCILLSAALNPHYPGNVKHRMKQVFQEQ